MGLTPRPWQGGQPDPDQDQDTDPQGTKIAQPNAGYQGPDQGPFKCANCEYFVAPGNCQRPEVLQQVGDADGDGVADVESEGCCNFYAKKGSE